MLRYGIHFADGGYIGHKGNIKIEGSTLFGYGSDGIIKLIIPMRRIKYVEVED